MKHDDLLDRLPETLKLIIQVTDYRTAMLLIENFGGTECYLPALSHVTETHPLSELVGFNNLKQICQYWQEGGRIYIPKADNYVRAVRAKRIEQDFKEMGIDQKSITSIARKYGLSDRHIRTFRKNFVSQYKPALKQSNQLDMFESI